MGQRKMSHEKWVEKAVKRWHGKYGYEESHYEGAFNPITITCPIHGQFVVRMAFQHLQKQGCPFCRKPLNGRGASPMSTARFVQDAIKIHGDTYDYRLVNYCGPTIKVTLICSVHGLFKCYPYNHLNGHGCARCKVKNQTLTQEQFVEKATQVHGGKYDYSRAVYVPFGRAGTPKIEIICPEHGPFWQRGYSHLSGAGCPKCAYVHKGRYGPQINLPYDELILIREVLNEYRQKDHINL